MIRFTRSALAVLALTIFMVSSAFAASNEFTGATKKEAIVYIKNSLADPEIKLWVKENYHSERAFLVALNIAPKTTVVNVANNFSDYQLVGGDAKDVLMTTASIYLLVCAVVLVVLLV